MLPGTFFVRKEMACKCGCGFDVFDAELLYVLQILRSTADKAVIITSGCRCRGHNKSVGGKDNSQHLLGKAADIVVEGMHPEEVYRILDSIFPQQYGLGKYDTFTHIDVRSKAARW